MDLNIGRKLSELKGKPLKTLEVSLPLATGSIALLAVTGTDLMIALPVFSALTLLPPLLSYFYPRYEDRKRIREMEKEIVPCLYHASSVASFKPTEKVLKTISHGHRELSKEFKKAHREIETGSSVKKALKRMKERVDSDLVKRTVEVLVTGHESGADLSKALEETAEEAAQLYKVKRKREVASTVEKYTLLLAGGVIVPLLLGSLISVIGSLNFTGLSSMEIGLSQGVKEAIRRNSVLGNQLYIGVYSVLASFFVAYQEKKIERGLVYMAILLPVSILLFNFAMSINVLSLF